MAIRNRRGNYNDFEPDKMVSGEFGFILDGDPNVDDGQAVYGTFKNRVKRLCTYDEVSGLVANSKIYRDEAEQFKDDSEDFANISRSYAVGTNNQVRHNDEIDNSKYYKEWVQNAFDRNYPQFVTDFNTGHIMYASGGNLNFFFNENGHICWEF